MAVNWAEEMGIDLDVLRGEHPFHPSQLRNHREISKRSESYWAYQRISAATQYSSQAIFSTHKTDEVSDTTPTGAGKPVRKQAKVDAYDFTEAQLAIARRSLDAKDSV